MNVDLRALPGPSTRRIAVRVTKDALRHLRAGHPWIYAESITTHSHDGAPGDLAVVFDDRRAFAGIGLWDPRSPIRVRLLHTGRPRTIDDTFWHDRLATARDRRRPLLDDPATTGVRVVHGENDSLPGLVVDQYAETAVVKLYSAAWYPHLPTLAPILAELLDVDSLVLRLARALPSDAGRGLVDGAVLAGVTPPPTVEFRENGLVMEADPRAGQKTGYFLDQRENRARVRDRAAGRRVLDVFCCSGGFSLHAAAGGAAEVHSVDLSGPAIAAVRRNLGRNDADPAVASTRWHGHHGDAFEVMGGLVGRGERYDVVIIDPPSFAQRQVSVPRALGAYARLTRLGLELVEPGGLFVQASCSSRVAPGEFFDGVAATALAAGFELEEIERTGHPLDHPVGYAQGRYLKAVFATPHPS
ncbi:MAG: class I SAM-dependent rRNA methyltransferase [Acidimicrobiales bacterium]